MHVRVFSLVAMTALFGALWSSDQGYQQVRLARAADLRARALSRAVPEIVPVRAARPQRTGALARATALASLRDWTARSRARLEEEGCRLRWEIRRTLDGQSRRLAAAIRGRANWADVARGLTRDAMRRVESAVRSAAVARPVETR